VGRRHLGQTRQGIAQRWRADRRTRGRGLVRIAHCKKARPVETPARIRLAAKAGDLLMAEHSLGLSKGGIAAAQMFHHPGKRPILCIGKGENVAVEIHDLDADRPVIERFPPR